MWLWYIRGYFCHMRKNNAVLGLIIGLFLPVVGMAISYLIWFRAYSVDSFLNRVFTDSNIASKVIALSVLINILPFIFYTNRKLDLTGRGVMVATMLYGVLFLLLKFVW